jgi:hypothetical protein
MMSSKRKILARLVPWDMVIRKGCGDNEEERGLLLNQTVGEKVCSDGLKRYIATFAGII